MDHKSFTDGYFAEVKLQCDKATPGPWISYLKMSTSFAKLSKNKGNRLFFKLLSELCITLIVF
jgi:hypothetical protein